MNIIGTLLDGEGGEREREGGRRGGGRERGREGERERERRERETGKLTDFKVMYVANDHYIPLFPCEQWHHGITDPHNVLFIHIAVSLT